tara:strand:- start:176 stop:604 length:429 start_codon:yes stop_codon:yes gene_type:complete
MKNIYPIFLVLFISEGFAQIVTKTEEFDDGGLKSITYFKKVENKFVVDKEEQFYDDGSLWYRCELKRIFDKKDWKYIKMKDGRFSSFHSNGSKKEEGLYKENRKDGKWISWYGNGYKMSEEIYKDGLKISKKSWNDDGSGKD